MDTPSSTSNDMSTVQPVAEGETVMSPVQKRFYASEQCETARLALQQLVDNPKYETDSSHFDGYALGFVDRHLYYLSIHPTTLVDGYISNLKLMTRIRSGR